jgi:hypothetical protein
VCLKLSVEVDEAGRIAVNFMISVLHLRLSRQCAAMGLRLLKAGVIGSVCVKAISCMMCSERVTAKNNCVGLSPQPSLERNIRGCGRQCDDLGLPVIEESNMNPVSRKGITCRKHSKLFGDERKSADEIFSLFLSSGTHGRRDNSRQCDSR